MSDSKRVYEIGWRSPSNIALVKYWGKFEEQIPINSSVSLTLDKCYTDTYIKFRAQRAERLPLVSKFTFMGEEASSSFVGKVSKFLSSLKIEMPFLKDYTLEVESRNSFPHSVGIASSASSFSALALCLVSFEDFYFQRESSSEAFIERCSFIARMGSGSASRSVIPFCAVWGKSELEMKGSWLKACPIDLPGIHKAVKRLRNTILVLDATPKSLSSSEGHKMMDGHPFRDARVLWAEKNTRELLRHLASGDWENAGEIIENEAMQLHGLVMTATDQIYMMPKSLEIIRRIRKMRTENKIPLFFTMDAGPNIHLLYDSANEVEARNFVKDLLSCGLVQSYIEDKVGPGPKKLGMRVESSSS